MLLAGDVGGTKTLLGIFEPGDRRPAAVAAHAYVTSAFDSFGAILDTFLSDLGQTVRIEAAALGVAGPVIANRARLTNILWDLSAKEVGVRLGSSRVLLLNDLEAMANSVEVLRADELLVLQEGVARQDGNAAVLAAGTGLGQALLVRANGRLRAVPSEGGHADFAARTDREMEFVRMLRERYGRAEVEQVLSGMGILNLHQFTHRGGECGMTEGGSVVTPALVSQAGLTGRCQGCADALRMFVSAYGAEAGNLALRGMATSGLYVGGGIAPKILPALETGTFMEAFLAKAPMAELLSKVPVKVILSADAGLIGAAVAAQDGAGGP